MLYTRPSSCEYRDGRTDRQVGGVTDRPDPGKWNSERDFFCGYLRDRPWLLVSGRYRIGWFRAQHGAL